MHRISIRKYHSNCRIIPKLEIHTDPVCAIHTGPQNTSKMPHFSSLGRHYLSLLDHPNGHYIPEPSGHLPSALIQRKMGFPLNSTSFCLFMASTVALIDIFLFTELIYFFCIERDLGENVPIPPCSLSPWSTIFCTLVILSRSRDLNGLSIYKRKHRNPHGRS